MRLKAMDIKSMFVTAILLFVGNNSNTAVAFAPRAFVAAAQQTSPALGVPDSDIFTHMIPPQFTDALSLAISQEGVGSDLESSLMDGPMQTIVLGAAAILALLVTIRSLGGAMDDAIGKILEGFEETMKVAYPEEWEEMQSELEGLEEPQRSETLGKIMENMKKDSPELYKEVMTKTANS